MYSVLKCLRELQVPQSMCMYKVSQGRCRYSVSGEFQVLKERCMCTGWSVREVDVQRGEDVKFKTICTADSDHLTI